MQINAWTILQLTCLIWFFSIYNLIRRRRLILMYNLVYINLINENFAKEHTYSMTVCFHVLQTGKGLTPPNYSHSNLGKFYWTFATFLPSQMDLHDVHLVVLFLSCDNELPFWRACSCWGKSPHYWPCCSLFFRCGCPRQSHCMLDLTAFYSALRHNTYSYTWLNLNYVIYMDVRE